MSFRRVIVTGAAGFLGSHLVNELLDWRDVETVIGLDDLSTGRLENLKSAFTFVPRFQFLLADVRDPISVQADLILNFACPASPVQYKKRPCATLLTSVVGAQRVVEAARKTGATIVHASTSEVYGDPLEHPQREEYWGHVNPIGPRACYDEGKRAAEALLTDAARTFGLDVRIIRIFNTYGPRMAPDDGRVVSSFIVSAIENRPLVIQGDGEQTRSFCYVRDLIRGIRKVVEESPLPGPVNLGNSQEISINGLVRELERICGRQLEREYVPLADATDPRRRCPDLALAWEGLSFLPEWTLEDGLRGTWEYFRQQKILRGKL